MRRNIEPLTTAPEPSSHLLGGDEQPSFHVEQETTENAQVFTLSEEPIFADEPLEAFDPAAMAVEEAGPAPVTTGTPGGAGLMSGIAAGLGVDLPPHVAMALDLEARRIELDAREALLNARHEIKAGLNDRITSQYVASSLHMGQDNVPIVTPQAPAAPRPVMPTMPGRQPEYGTAVRKDPTRHYLPIEGVHAGNPTTMLQDYMDMRDPYDQSQPMYRVESEDPAITGKTGMVILSCSLRSYQFVLQGNAQDAKALISRPSAPREDQFHGTVQEYDTIKKEEGFINLPGGVPTLAGMGSVGMMPAQDGHLVA